MDRTSRALGVTHPTIRRQYYECFCLRPGKVWRTTRDPDVQNCLRHYLTCDAKRCCFFQWIDLSWISEENINLTNDVSPWRISS